MEHITTSEAVEFVRCCVILMSEEVWFFKFFFLVLHHTLAHIPLLSWIVCFIVDFSIGIVVVYLLLEHGTIDSFVMVTDHVVRT